MEVKFSPSDSEIITNYLHPKVEGLLFTPCDYITVQEQLYSLAPRSLNWERVPQLHDEERYYFAKKAKVSKSSNKTERYRCDDGFWKPNRDHRIPILDDAKSCIIGYYKTLNFWLYNNNNNDLQKTDKRRVIKSHWVMYEYQLPGDVQEWVVCRIRNNNEVKAKTIKGGRDPNKVVLGLPLQQVVSSSELHHHHHHLDVENFTALLNMPPADEQKIVTSFTFTKLDHHLDTIIIKEDDWLIPNFPVIRGLIEPPSRIIKY